MTPTPALAGAWITPELQQNIWTAALGEREGLPVYETGNYFERPIDDRLSYVSTSWFDEDPAGGQRGEATMGLKRILRQDDNWVLAASASALWATATSPLCDETGAEVRFLGGYSRGRSFVNLEVAERVISGGCGGERVEITAGYRPAENWLALGQLLFDGPRENSGETVKLQISLVAFRESGLGIQVGLRGRVDGGELEPALVLGLWMPPPDEDEEDDD